jgi:hypothetical protein
MWHRHPRTRPARVRNVENDPLRTLLARVARLPNLICNDRYPLQFRISGSQSCPEELSIIAGLSVGAVTKAGTA